MKRLALFLTLFGVLHADPFLPYIKGGAGSGGLALGLGGRQRLNERQGFDVSVNGQTTIFDSYLTLKGLYLHYSNSCYFGLGGGFGWGEHAGFVPIGGHGGYCHSTRFGTFDAAIGYEFRRTKRFRPFIQLEFSQPIAKCGPAVFLTTGFGW